MGSTELIRRRAMMGKSKPYDAEIEYIGKGSGNTAFIDTGINGNQDIRFEISFLSVFSGLYAIGGRRESNTNSLSITLQSVKRFGAKSTSYGEPTINNIHTYIIDNTGLKLDGTTLATWSDVDDYSCGSLMLFNVGDNTTFLNGNIYSCRIWENNQLVRDMIPVRVGTTGYMYDKVSGQLFGNAGTGSFILGNDI